ncbi:MAG: hypothetical protein U0736_13115 [Gemmataceae bacterium]
MARSRAEKAAGDRPRCQVCEATRPGQVYSFWGGFLTSYRETGSVLSSVKFVTAKYRNMRKCGVFVCRECASRTKRIGHLPGAIGWGVGVAAFAGLTLAARSAPDWVFWGLTALTAVFGLLWLLDLVQLIRPSLDSPRMELLLLRRVRKKLIADGKGDEFFTEADYRALFKKDPSGMESAEDILAAAGQSLDDDEDDQPRRRRRKREAGAAPEEAKPCPHCGGQIPAYAQACSHCKKILV